jgi:hypothetical protein
VNILAERPEALQRELGVKQFAERQTLGHVECSPTRPRAFMTLYTAASTTLPLADESQGGASAREVVRE